MIPVECIHQPSITIAMENLSFVTTDSDMQATAAATRKESNEDSCPLYKLPIDLLKLIVGYVGENHYRLVACTSDRLHKVYAEIFVDDTWTSFENVVVSLSCMKLCLLDTEAPNYTEPDPDCNTITWLFHIAASEGKLELLKWGMDSGYELDKILDEDAISNAAYNGHLHVVKYLRQLGVIWDEETCANVAERGRLDLLKYVREQGAPWNELTCSDAAEKGHLDVLKYAREQGCPWDRKTCSNAAANGHLDVLKYAREQGCPWDTMTCTNAARNGHLDVLKYAREQECPWNKLTCSNAAEKGHLDVLKYAREQECPWDKFVCANAADNGHLHVLKYAREQGCPWDGLTLSNAARNGHLDVLTYAREQGCPSDIRHDHIFDHPLLDIRHDHIYDHLLNTDDDMHRHLLAMMQRSSFFLGRSRR